MKTIKEFFPNHILKDKYDLELQQFTAEDVEAYTIHILQYLAEDCEEMDVKETIRNKINNIW